MEVCMQRIITFWNKGWMGKAVLSIVGLLLVCCVFGIFAPRSTQQPATSAPAALAATQAPEATAVPQSTEAPATAEPTDAPTAEVLATLATDVPTSPTEAPQPTTKPAPAVDSSAPSYPCTSGQFKGNRNSKIYHAPGQEAYAKTQADVRCFDTEAAAETAGYRKAKR